MRSESSMGSVIIGVGVRWDEELGGFSFEEVLVNAEQGGVDKDEEVSAGEIILVVSDDGLSLEGVLGSSVRFATAYVHLRGEGMMEEGRKERWGGK